MCVMEPASYALNDCAILNEDETIWMTPSVDPSRRFAEPVQRDDSSDYSGRQVRYWIAVMNKGSAANGELRTSTYAENRSALFRQLDRRDVEEVECFPLGGMREYVM